MSLSGCESARIMQPPWLVLSRALIRLVLRVVRHLMDFGSLIFYGRYVEQTLKPHGLDHLWAGWKLRMSERTWAFLRRNGPYLS